MTQGTSITILRALAWKEWREQRAVVVTGLVVAVLIPLLLKAGTATSPRPLDLPALAGVLPVIYVSMLWPLFMAMLGAGSTANELGDGTLGFLLSRPASRGRIWSVKVGVAFLSGLVILAGSMMVALTVGWLSGALGGTTPGPLEQFRQGVAGPEGALLELIVSMTLLLFATSVFFSTFLSRAMTAAAGGVAAALLILFGLFLLWSGLELVPRLAAEWMALEVTLIAGLILLGSLLVFSRGELLRGGGSRRLVVMTSLMAVGGAGLVTVPFSQAYGRLTPDKAVVATLAPSRSGDAVLATVTGKDKLVPQIWLIHTDGSGMDRLTGRLTYAPAISADGQWIAYLSQRGVFGLRSQAIELRAMRANGNDDRWLATLTDYGLPGRGSRTTPIAFSPDGSRVAVVGDDRLLIATLHERGVKWIDLSRGPFRQGSVGGWLEGGEEVLVISDGARWSSKGAASLAAVDAVSGDIRTLYESPSKTSLWLPAARTAAWTRVPIIVEGRLLLLEPRTGGTEEITTKASWWSPALADDGRLLVYAVYHRVKGAAGDSEIHLRDLSNGADETLATVPGMAGDILLSPSNDSLVVNRYVDGRPIPSLIVTRTGQVRELPAPWVCLGWQGRERILLAQAVDAARIAVADAATGEVRPIFP